MNFSFFTYVGQRVKWKDQDLAGKITNVRRFTGFSGVACWQVKIEVTATGKVYETIWPDDDVFIVKVGLYICRGRKRESFFFGDPLFHVQV